MSPLIALHVSLLKRGISFHVVCLHLLATSDIRTCDVSQRGSNTYQLGYTSETTLLPRAWFMQDVTAKVTAKAVKFCRSFQDACMAQWI